MCPQNRDEFTRAADTLGKGTVAPELRVPVRRVGAQLREIPQARGGGSPTRKIGDVWQPRSGGGSRRHTLRSDETASCASRLRPSPERKAAPRRWDPPPARRPY